MDTGDLIAIDSADDATVHYRSPVQSPRLTGASAGHDYVQMDSSGKHAMTTGEIKYQWC